MENNIYKKTKNGYTLRQHNASVGIVSACVLCLGLILPCDALVKHIENTPQALNFEVIIGFFLVCIAVAVGILRTEWCRMNLDEKGIYFHRPLARKKFIAWKDVQDWGIAYQRSRYGLGYNFYFSLEPLKPTRQGKNKKMPITYKKAIYIRIEYNDLSSLKCAEVINFCLSHLDGNGNHTPMFTADLVL